MTRTCIIIEDQPPAQRILQKYIADCGTLELKATFSNALDALGFLKDEQIDLIFLDIHLPKISGMEFLKTLQQPAHIILTTAFSEYALESYQYQVIDYLVKPFSFQRFIQAVTKSNGLSAKKTNLPNSTKIEPNKAVFFIKSGYDLIKVERDAILYLKADTDYTEIVTETKIHLSNERLKTWLAKLGSTFCQIHKSYIVNINYIEKISGNRLYLHNNSVLPIGRTYKESFLAAYIK